MSSYKKIKVGLLGIGKMGSFHAKTLPNIPGISFKGAFDLDQAKLQETAQLLNFKPYTSLDSLLEKVDAVIIVTPTTTHLSLGSLCLEKGKHVFIEKPLAATFEAAEKLVVLAKEKGLILGVGHIERVNPAFSALEEAMHKELLLKLKIHRQSPFPERMAQESVVSDMMIHDLDLALHLAKCNPKEIVILDKKGKPSCLDKVEVKIFFESGLVATVLASRLHDSKERKVWATCESHNFEADLLNKTLKIGIPPDTANLHPLDASKMEELPIRSYDQLTREQRLFILSIRRGDSLCVSGEEAAKAVKLAEEIERLATC
ncbi:MAG: Gfo/Idh/MocA family oxidoreductase [Candidatus Saganbacteria bacterium]|nr:Gfo/Idh/MocA family oxidoreductase [Candidatus Saganbacteria bacterium]